MWLKHSDKERGGQGQAIVSYNKDCRDGRQARIWMLDMIRQLGYKQERQKVSDIEKKGLSLLTISGSTEDKPKMPQYTECLEKLVHIVYST